METEPGKSAGTLVACMPEDKVSDHGEDEMEQGGQLRLELPQAPHDKTEPFDSSMTAIQRARRSVIKSDSLGGLQRLLSIRDDNPLVKVGELSGSRKILACIVRTELFEVGIIGILLLNLIFVVVETELRARDVESPVATYIGIIFLACYFMELVARIFVERCSYFKDTLNKLDFIIVVADVIVQSLVFASDKPSLAWLRLFRIMRLLRVIRRIEGFRELWLMLHGFASAVKAMTWACFLMIFFLIAWSLVAVELIKPKMAELENTDAFDECGDACRVAFNTISNSMMTWFFLIFAGELWKDLVVPVVAVTPAFSIIFFAAFVTIHLGLMNLILTVIVDRAAAARVDDEHLRADDKRVGFEKAREKLVRLCELMDTDESGCLTLEELQSGFETNNEFASTLKAMDVAKEDLRTVFQILDEDRSGSVTYDEFVAQLHKMKTQEAQTLLVFIKYYVVDVRQKVSEQLDILKSELVEKVDEQSAITNRLARRMGRAAGIDMCPTPVHSNTMNFNNEMPLSPNSVYCAGSPRVVEKGCFSRSPSSTRADRNVSRTWESADRNLSRTGMLMGTAYDGPVIQERNVSRPPENNILKTLEGTGTDTPGSSRMDASGTLGAWHELGQTSGSPWSRQNVVSAESKASMGLGEISLRMEGTVSTEIRQLSERVEQAMSVFLRESAAQQAKHTESLEAIERTLRQLARDPAYSKKIGDNTYAMRRSASDCSGDSGPISAVIVPMAHQHNYPSTVAESPGQTPGTRSCFEESTLLEESTSKPSSPQRKSDLAL
eukprot:TRINITY_DN5995_c0_g1_i1.p1 TRINITY_DN5995_c0_g1~~TRINITY_DN5995_c0_g1_i1.p1  ORF type:complete len:807 (+),score=145.97 TRINITY_DN5995_c0_g1_i1:81-2423(+)